MSNSRIHPVERVQMTRFTSSSAWCCPPGSEPVGALEKILLIDGVQYFHHRLLHDLVFQSGYRDLSLLPVLLRYVDPAERLGLLLSVFEPLIKLLDLSLGVLLVFLIRDPVHPCAGFLS